MIRDMLFKLEREAEQRVRDAHDREIDLGGPGSARRASEAMNAPMLEAAAIRKMRQRFGDLQMEIDQQNDLLRRTRRNTDLPSEVRRHRVGQAETKLAELGESFKALETEVTDRFFPELNRQASPRRPRSAPLAGQSARRARAATTPVRADTVAGRSRPNPAIDRLLARRSPPIEPEEPDGTERSLPTEQETETGKVKNVGQAGAVALPEGAELRPVLEGKAPSFDWPKLSGSLLRALPRYASATAAGLTVALTPWNDEGRYSYLSDDERLWLAPGDAHAPIERRDPRTGEWKKTDLIGMFIGGSEAEGARILTGTPDQVNRAAKEILYGTKDKSPRAEPLTPAPSGKGEPESFPSEEQGPTVLVTPGEERGPTVLSTPAEKREQDIEILPIPELPQAQAEVFLALSDEVVRALTRPLEAHRGDEYTQRGNDIAVQKVYEQLQRWFPDLDVERTFVHRAGATYLGKGEDERKERFVRGDGGHYSIPDIMIRDTESNRWLVFNTGQVLKDKRTLNAAERRQLERLRKNLENKGVAEGLPKLRPGMDENEYATRVERRLEAFFTRQFGKPPGN